MTVYGYSQPALLVRDYGMLRVSWKLSPNEMCVCVCVCVSVRVNVVIGKCESIRKVAIQPKPFRSFYNMPELFDGVRSYGLRCLVRI